MKKVTKKLACLLFVFAVLFTVAAVAASAESTMKVTLRVEGIQSCLFYKTEEVPYTDSLTLQSALQSIDQKEDSLTMTGVDAGYISDIDGETAAKFGGWDGWMYRVNGADAGVGISDYSLKDGDSVVFYYGDPYGVGMQFPTADTSKLADGILKFTSADTTYDADGKATVAVNPVSGATVTWGYGSASAAYTTDANGEIQIDASQLSAGAHGVQIAKTSDNGIPLVLRFAPDYTIAVSESATTSAVTTESSAVPETSVSSASTTAVTQAVSTTDSSTTITADTASAADETASPKTGGGSGVSLVIFSAALLGVAVLTGRGRRRSDEK